MNKIEIADRLKQVLIENVPNTTPASGGRFVLTKCVFCPDGKHHNSRHMYISLGYDDEIAWCYCHLCHNSAIVSAEFLASYFNVYDVDFLVSLSKYNKYVKTLPKNIDKNKEIYQLFNTKFASGNQSKRKLKYINDRLGVNLTLKDLSNLKIILNLHDVLIQNNITKYSRDLRVVDGLDEHFMGFISADNAFINLRNIEPKGMLHKSIDKRYVKYNIFNKLESYLSFYAIPNNIDVTNPERIKLHLSEGPYDILSVYLNLRKELNHNIYAAAGGTGFINVIKYYINKLKLINIEIHLYRDNDYPDYKLYQIAELVNPFLIPVYVHSNKCVGEKDFGVPLNKIQEEIIRVV